MTFILGGIKDFWQVYRYAYPSARAKAMKSFLLKEEDYQAIIDSKDLEDALGLLKETAYKDVSASNGNLFEFEAALNEHIAKELSKTASSIPETAKTIFKRYLAIYEAENIISVFIQLKAKKHFKEQTKRFFVPLYVYLTPGHYERLISSGRVEDAINILKDTVYSQNLKEAYREYKSSASLIPVETALYRTIYDEVYSAISISRGPDIDALKNIIGIEIDILNLKSILRMKAGKSTTKNIKKYIIKRWHSLDPAHIENIVNAATLDEITSLLRDTPYHGPLSKMAKLSDTHMEKKLQIIEKNFESFISETASRFERDFPLGIGPIIGYAMQKKFEVKRLLALIKLKESGFTRHDIEEIL